MKSEYPLKLLKKRLSESRRRYKLSYAITEDILNIYLYFKDIITPIFKNDWKRN